jgi:hypothetical protein
MSRKGRYLVNAVVLLLIGAHGVYRFVTQREDLAAEGLWFALVVAQAVVGIAGAVWFFARSRQVSG